MDASINGTFLHRREFMEYHRDRFADASLILYKKEKPIAIFPAEQEGKTVFSHRGLTYAGWIITFGLSLETMESIIAKTLAYYLTQTMSQVDVRLVPDFFAKGSQDLLKEVLLDRGDKSIYSVNHHCTPLPFRVSNSGKKWGRKKALKNAICVGESEDFRTFWEKVLIPNLQSRHGVSPTHTIDEIQNLKQKFPTQIRLYTAMREGEMLGGVVVFYTDTCAHLQYVGATTHGKSLSCLDLLVTWLVEEKIQGKAYFNMGVSHIPATGGINQGLVQWKESFGGKGVEVATYRLPTKTHVIQH